MATAEYRRGHGTPQLEKLIDPTRFWKTLVSGPKSVYHEGFR